MSKKKSKVNETQVTKTQVVESVAPQTAKSQRGRPTGSKGTVQISVASLLAIVNNCREQVVESWRGWLTRYNADKIRAQAKAQVEAIEKASQEQSEQAEQAEAKISVTEP